MKALKEDFRDPEKAEEISSRIRELAGSLGEVKLMNVCGTHEMSIVKHGIRDLIPDNIHLIAGPGCPVCVTPSREIDEAIELADRGKIVTTFGDMFRVPGSESSLSEARTNGAEVEIVYGISDAVETARENPDMEVVHVAIGFETTAPTTAAEVLRGPPENFGLLVCHRLIPPAMELLLTSGETEIDGYMDPGHVSTIIGTEPYERLSEEYGIPQVVTGFEPLDVLLATLMLLQQIDEDRGEVENEYERFVNSEGNVEAQERMEEVFEITDDKWRGFPEISKSKLELQDEFASYDARKRFDIGIKESQDFAEGCRCGEVLKGLITPSECPLFLEECFPDSPVGPCMVSVEGACSVWAKHGELDRV